MPFRSKIQKAYLYALKIGRIPVLILIVGFLLAVLVFQFLLQYQVEHAEKEFYDIADRVYQSSSIELRKHTQIVYSVGNILGQIENLTEEEFSNISNLFINTTHFEQFHYYKWKNVSDEGGEGRAMAEEIFSHSGFSSALHGMQGFENITEVIEVSRRNGLLSISKPFKGNNSDNSVNMMALTIPISKNNNEIFFLVGIVNLDSMFQEIVKASDFEANFIVISNYNENNEIIFKKIDEAYALNYSPQRVLDYEEIYYARPYFWNNDIKWQFIMLPLANSEILNVGLLPWISFLSILSITALLGFIFWRLSSEKLKIQKKVDEQTKSLKDYALKLEIINRDLDDFAYVASHDLKEPLRGLYNYAEILEEDYQGKLDEDGRKKLETLKTLAKRMELFVERLFQYSKLSRVELKSAKVDVSELIANVIDIQNIWLQERNATVEIVDEMPMIVCDPPQIEEVFRNLITNGVKYNDKDQKKITIGCKYRPVKNSEPIPVFWVGDNGIGIDSEHKKHIFKIFKRLHGRDEYGGGSGAGLTIVWKIIERHNGQIWVESEKGKGSVFYFTLTGYINDVRSSESENSNLGG